MNDELYFIPILTKAIESTDVRSALQEAFKTIREKSRLPVYEQGFQQFQHFMEDVRLSAGYEQSNIDGLSGSIMERFKYPKLLAMQIELNGKLLCKLTLNGDYDRLIADSILPGDYVLKVNNRTVWQGALNGAELLWADAFDASPLKAAADTENIRQRPTRQIRLLDNTLTVDIHPGPTCGSIVITTANFWEQI